MGLKSSGSEGGVFRNFARQHLCQESGLEFQRAAVADFVVEDRVRQQGTHALLIGLKEPLATGRRQVDGLASLDKICVFSCEEYRDLKKAIAQAQ